MLTGITRQPASPAADIASIDQRRDDTKRAGDEECGQVARKHGSRQTGAERRRGGAELVAGKDPAEHQIGALGPEALRGQPHRRRHGGDPVEAVEHREQRQAVEREIGERQQQQRQPAQAIIPEQQLAIVVAVRQPAGSDGAEEIEHAHRGEQARRLHLRNAEIEAHRNQMHLDQPVGAGAADEERREQDPEHPASSRHRAARRTRPP